jgi:hypothetical protein
MHHAFLPTHDPPENCRISELATGVERVVKSVSSLRVMVLLEFMGREQLVSVDRHQLKVT